MYGISLWRKIYGRTINTGCGLGHRMKSYSTHGNLNKSLGTKSRDEWSRATIVINKKS